MMQVNVVCVGINARLFYHARKSGDRTELKVVEFALQNKQR